MAQDDPLPQTPEGHYLLPLQLALYDASRSPSAAVVERVTTALQTAVLCPLHILLVNNFNQNVCPDDPAVSDSVVFNDTSSSSSTPSILDAAPYAISVVPVNDDGFAWTVWTLQYTLLQVGDVYVTEALQNYPADGDIAALAPAAAQSLRAVLQLTLDVNAATLDALLLSRRSNGTSSFDDDDAALYVSPVEEALRKWQALAAQDAPNDWQPRTWYPLRTAGLVLWVLTVLVAASLPRLAARRRKREW
jgi:hypothetical protein